MHDVAECKPRAAERRVRRKTLKLALSRPPGCPSFPGRSGCQSRRGLRSNSPCLRGGTAILCRSGKTRRLTQRFAGRFVAILPTLESKKCCEEAPCRCFHQFGTVTRIATQRRG